MTNAGPWPSRCRQPSWTGYWRRLTRPARPSSPAPDVAPPSPGLVAALNARELEVLQLLAAGSSNRAIAEELVIDLDMVKRHVTHILDKLGAANRIQAVTRARELGLLR
jgi:ATP/maltotriose-dependent transcriptional regulator MalT